MIHEILKSRLFRILGAITILYFALFSQKDNPESLANRFSSENIKKNKQIMSEKAKIIAENIKAARSESVSHSSAHSVSDEKFENGDQKQIDQVDNEQVSKINEVESGDKNIRIRDILISASGASVSCGDEVKFIYAIFDHNLKIINSSQVLSVKIGKIGDDLVLKNVSLMRDGSSREVYIEQGAKISDKRIKAIMDRVKSPIKIQINLISVTKSEKQSEC